MKHEKSLCDGRKKNSDTAKWSFAVDNVIHFTNIFVYMVYKVYTRQDKVVLGHRRE